METPEEDIDEDSVFIVEKRMPLEKARKDIDAFTGKPYDEDDSSSVSEWALAFATSEFAIGQEISGKQLLEALQIAKTQQILDSLEDKGLMQSLWDPEKECIVYKVKE